ncbi:hypothetical protein Droror1_Dr00006778 [Drosera rotundifolia]
MGNSSLFPSTKYLARGSSPRISICLGSSICKSSLFLVIPLAPSPLSIQGKGNREEQFYLWFDPREDFHTYSVSWNPQNIIFFVDGTPVRQFKNMESIGVPFPNKQPMRIYSSLWDGEDWATEGGRIKTDWTKAPFTASYGGFSINACKISPRGNSCAASKSTVTTTSAGGAYSNIVNSWMNEEIDFTNQEKLNWVRQNYMVYNYCMDTNRFPQGLPPECNVS